MIWLQTPLYTKSLAFVVWLLQLTRQVPKDQRPVLLRRIQENALTLLEVIALAITKPQQRKEYLSAADCCLVRIRMGLHVAESMNLITIRKTAYATAQMKEIGRMIGGWLRIHNPQQQAQQASNS